MKMKKLLAGILSLSMLATATAAFAAAPSAYDGQTYESLGYTSDDTDGQFNLAVISNGDVKIFGDAMYIKGSVYSAGNIYVGDGQGNKIDGLFISGTEGSFDESGNADDTTTWQCDGYIHVNDNGTRDGITAYSTKPEYAGAIKDTDTSFECSYSDFVVPAEFDEELGDTTMTVFYNDDYSTGYNVYDDDGNWVEYVPGTDGTEPKTITSDTHIGTLTINGSRDNWRGLDYAMTVDTTDGDVTVVIDSLEAVNPNIQVVGGNQAYIYIKNVSTLSNLALNYLDGEENGSVENTHLYLVGDNIVINSSTIAVADMTVNASTLEISGSTLFYGDIESGAESFTITDGQTEVYGIVCVPNAVSEVIDSGTLYGQLHTGTLTVNGAGRIIWQADSAVAITEEEPAPVTEEPTPTPDVPKGNEIDLYGLGYAYIFGYEPGEAVDGFTPIYMAPNDAVTREQVASMLMRMIDQKNGAGETYSLTDNIAAHNGTWYVRGLAYLADKGTFDGIEKVEVGPVTRGEVAKLVAYGLNLSDTMETAFTDIADSPYKTYIEIMAAYGYMNGTSDTGFEPNRIMTRAEFCKMFNNIIGREDMGLETADGTIVTPEDYSIVDISGHWAEETMLKATSAYDRNGYVDFAMRQDNIRNKLDNYDSQLQY